MAHVTTRKGPFAVATSSPLQRRMPRMRATCARSARPHRLTPSRNVVVARYGGFAQCGCSGGWWVRSELGGSGSRVALSLPEDGWGLLPLS